MMRSGQDVVGHPKPAADATPALGRTVPSWSRTRATQIVVEALEGLAKLDMEPLTVRRTVDTVLAPVSASATFSHLLDRSRQTSRDPIEVPRLGVRWLALFEP